MCVYTLLNVFSSWVKLLFTWVRETHNLVTPAFLSGERNHQIAIKQSYQVALRAGGLPGWGLRGKTGLKRGKSGGIEACNCIFVPTHTCTHALMHSCTCTPAHLHAHIHTPHTHSVHIKQIVYIVYIPLCRKKSGLNIPFVKESMTLAEKININ